MSQGEFPNDGLSDPELLQAYTEAANLFSHARSLTDLLGGQIMQRGLDIPVPAAASEDPADLGVSKSEFEVTTEKFLRGRALLETGEQLSFMNEFWNKLGYQIPELSSQQWGFIDSTLEVNPVKRVIPTPVFKNPFEDRNTLAMKGRQLWIENREDWHDKIFPPKEYEDYYKLLIEPEDVVRSHDNTYGLRYKTPGGGLVSRNELIEALRQEGKVASGEDGTPWVFPVMDMRVKFQRDHHCYTIGDLFRKVDATVMPESLMAVYFLHSANRTPQVMTGEYMEVGNEAICGLSQEKSTAIDTTWVAAFYSRPWVSPFNARPQLFSLTMCNPGSSAEDFIYRDGLGGLKRRFEVPN